MWSAAWVLVGHFFVGGGAVPCPSQFLFCCVLSWFGWPLPGVGMLWIWQFLIFSLCELQCQHISKWLCWFAFLKLVKGNTKYLMPIKNTKEDGRG